MQKLALYVKGGWSGGRSCACTHLPSYALGYDHNLKTGNISHYIQLNSEGLKEFVTVWTTLSMKGSKYTYLSIKWYCIYFCDDSYYVVFKFFIITSLFKICIYIISSAPWFALRGICYRFITLLVQICHTPFQE